MTSMVLLKAVVTKQMSYTAIIDTYKHLSHFFSEMCVTEKKFGVCVHIYYNEKFIHLYFRFPYGIEACYNKR